MSPIEAVALVGTFFALRFAVPLCMSLGLCAGMNYLADRATKSAL